MLRTLDEIYTLKFERDVIKSPFNSANIYLLGLLNYHRLFEYKDSIFFYPASLCSFCIENKPNDKMPLQGIKLITEITIRKLSHHSTEENGLNQDFIQSIHHTFRLFMTLILNSWQSIEKTLEENVNVLSNSTNIYEMKFDHRLYRNEDLKDEKIINQFENLLEDETRLFSLQIVFKNIIQENDPTLNQYSIKFLNKEFYIYSSKENLEKIKKIFQSENQILNSFKKRFTQTKKALQE